MGGLSCVGLAIVSSFGFGNYLGLLYANINTSIAFIALVPFVLFPPSRSLFSWIFAIASLKAPLFFLALFLPLLLSLSLSRILHCTGHRG